ncbi:MAG: class I SAM-dependent methyltransferase, partial [Candidatus Hermodarchaeota archaeon]
MKFYDSTKKQLIYIEKKASPSFWDEHWNIDGNIKDELLKIKHSLVSQVTRKYMKPKDGIILEGGCGRGEHVASLTNSGYRAIGLDYAKKTVDKLNKYVPELDIRF